MQTASPSANRWNSPSLQYGRSLPRSYYCDPEVFEQDMRMLGATQWLLVDHASRIPHAGDFFLYDLGDENFIFVRDKSMQIRGFFNVCRHRGSRVCLEREGHARSFICPYHAWNYDLDGRLRAAAAMPDGFDKSQHGLRPVHVGVLDGFIFINLAEAAPQSFDAFAERFRPFLLPHGFEDGKVAVRVNYPTDANWKLVVENFKECYHCKPAHPTYCSVHDADKLLALGAGPGSASGDLANKFDEELKHWETTTRAKGGVTGMFADGVESRWFQTACRLPIGKGYSTESIGGAAVAPLMGAFREYDGGQTAIVFNPVSYIMASNDHAMVVRFTPRGPMKTDVETLWIVRSDAVAGQDYDPSALIRVWDVTLREDKVITENNQLGVLSRGYSPGPHSLHESRISDFLEWYVRQMRSCPEHSS